MEWPLNQSSVITHPGITWKPFANKLFRKLEPGAIGTRWMGLGRGIEKSFWTHIHIPDISIHPYIYIHIYIHTYIYIYISRIWLFPHNSGTHEISSTNLIPWFPGSEPSSSPSSRTVRVKGCPSLESCQFYATEPVVLGIAKLYGL